MAAMKDGLPKKSYAYAPSDTPSDWKLPYLTAAGAPDPDHLPGAVAALTSFRGQEADIPATALPMVKSKLRQAYRKWKGTDVKYPASIAEAGSISTYPSTCYSCNHATDCDCTTCMCSVNHTDPSVIGVGKALDAIGNLVDLLGDEADEPAQAALIQNAVNSILKFVPLEIGEIITPSAVNESDTIEQAMVVLREAGARNSKQDMARLTSMHHLTHELGVNHPPFEDNSSTPMTMAPAATLTESYSVDTKTAPGAIVFAESGTDSLFVTLSEAEPEFDDKTKTVWITPIKPGFGNQRDGFYYPTATLREATDAGRFDGLKMFRNHPRKSDEKDLPERSVTDWFAVLKEAKWDETKNSPRAQMQVFSDEDWTKMKAAPEHVAFSVRGGGMARPGTAEGKQARIVESLTNLKSVDWVTQAGAGGAIFAESASDEELDMSVLDDLTGDQLKVANPKLYAELTGIKEAAAVADPPKTDPDPKVEAKATDVEAKTDAVPAADAPKSDEKVAEGDVLTKMADRLAVLEARDAANEAATKKAADLKTAKDTIEHEVKESLLPGAVKTALIGKLVSVAESAAVIDPEALKTQVANEIAFTSQLLGRKAPTPRPADVAGAAAPEVGSEAAPIREAVAAKLAGRWGPESIPSPDSAKADKGDKGDAADLSEANPNPIHAESQPVADRLGARFAS